MNINLIIYLLPVVGVLALIFAGLKALWVSKQEAGEDKMQEIAGHIADGAMAFLGREYKVLSFFVVAVAILLAVGNYSNATSYH